MDFTDKRVLITGGICGIGSGIVAGLVQAGVKVAVNGNSTESVSAAFHRFGSGSVATIERSRDVVTLPTRELGCLDVLVNNAGASSRNISIDDVDEAHWGRVVNTNICVTYSCIKFALSTYRRPGISRVERWRQVIVRLKQEW